MKPAAGCIWVLAVLTLAPARGAGQAAPRALAVHLCQAGNDTPYAFVRARFEPGELPDPWAVQFLDEGQNEVPFFVWDSLTWKVAREGRPDWGNRYALLQHASGRSPEAAASRARKIEWAQSNLPELGTELKAADEEAARSPESVCAALYLLRHRMPPFGKSRLALRLDAAPASSPRRRGARGDLAGTRVRIDQGPLRLDGLPDRLTVSWKGQEIFRSAGYEAGDVSGPFSHADPSRPFTVKVTEGLIARVQVEGSTIGRRGSEMRWQCSYWLFPEGALAALEGFSLGDAKDYLGGEQTLSIWEAPAEFVEVHRPLWEAPWWLHRSGEAAFVAIHQFSSLPLAIGYGNNPFSAGPDGQQKVLAAGRRLRLAWGYDIADRGIYRLFHRRLPVPPPQDPAPAWLTREAFLTGKPVNLPPGMPAEEARSLAEALSYARWEPRVDWLYRQYALGVGETGEDAEGALRRVLGAAWGWIDRGYREEELAELLGKSIFRRSRRRISPQPNRTVYDVLPYLVEGPDREGIRQILAAVPHPRDQARNQIQTIRNHIAAGESGVTGRWVENPHGEGWESNPAYHACDAPTALRFLEHFDLLPLARAAPEEYREALLEFADFSLDVLGGDPFRPEKLRESLHMGWPNRMVMLLPLVLHAHSIESDPRPASAAKLLFDELLSMAERNPHGYWAAWKFEPREAAIFDTVYNPVGYQRGITAFWAEGLLDLIGRDRAARFVAAQARYAVASGQFHDTFEADNPTAIHAYFHHAHPNFSSQVALYLYDDFPFYRGLVGELVKWSAAAGSGIDGYYAPLLRWTFGIGPGTSWYERRVEREPQPGGAFRVRVRSQLPWARNSLWVATQDAGMEPPGRWLLWLQAREPAWRLEPLLEFEARAGSLALALRRRARLRLYYSVPFPAWRESGDLALVHRAGDGAVREVTAGLEWASDETGERSLEWEAEPGRYELAPRRSP